MEVGRHVRMVPGIRGANAYVVLELDSNGGVTLIDTGMPGNGAKIVQFMKSLCRAEQLENLTILLTHPDMDHSGSAAELKDMLPNAKVAIHSNDASRLSGEKDLKEVRGPIGVLFKAMRPFMKFRPVKPDVVLKDGDTINWLTVIHTPGHTEGSISLHSDRLKAMFVGDALRTDSAGNLKVPSAAMTLNMAEAKESIKKLSSYEYDFLFPGHGAPILEAASRKMKEFAARL